jgi:predicted nuclease with TOPRIM domain
MNYKELIKTQLFLLKSMGKSRREIEKDLGYAEKYIDQALSRGGNENLFNALVIYKDNLTDQQNVVEEQPSQYIPQKELVELQKEIIQELRKEKMHLNSKVQALEAQIISLESRNQNLEAKLIQMAKQTRSA